ncbi:MAG: hypothetical protein IT372_18835 [Polyangiaceae bacterium]|nr:hypothetical protein [Polyangiaceae bacterium]
MKTPSPLLGFNNNVRHKGRLFHIQTEDSGVRHPHIITHLFADGGRILKTTKTSYAEHVGTPSMAETVRELMKEQHKAMFIALRDGQFDYLFDESAPRPPAPSSAGVRPADPPPTPGSAAVAPAPAAQVRPAAASSPAIAPAATAAPAPVAGAATAPIKGAAPIAPAPAAGAAAAAPPHPGPAPLAVTAAVVEPASRRTEPPPPMKRTSSRPRLDLDPAALQALSARAGAGSAPALQRPAVAPAAVGARASHPLTPAPAPGLGAEGAPRGARPGAPSVEPAPRAQEAQPAIDLDLEALERAAAEAQTPYFQQIQDLPPPPASVIGRRTEAASGAYTGVHPADPPVVAPPQLAAEHLGGGAGRYAPSRPSSIFATNRPAEGASIFGEDLISEKSLDEVILSYLAEDLDNPQDKK